MKSTHRQADSQRAQVFLDRVKNLPPSGGGGLHASMLGTANIGVWAGFSDEEIFDHIRRHIHGTRQVPDREIRAAIEKARATAKIDTTFAQSNSAPPIRGDEAFRSTVRAGDGATEAELWEASPVRLDWEREQDSVMALRFLYQSDEYLFIGDDSTPGVPGRSIRTVAEWISFHEKHGPSLFPKLILNPLTGQQGTTKDGKPSFRSDNCIADHRYMLCEFDSIPIEQQFAFWFACKLPVAAIVHSGKKSLHAWVRVDCVDAGEWATEIAGSLFPRILEPMGLDGACKNPARLSRMPGHIRDGVHQKILYLAPEGRPVNA